MNDRTIDRGGMLGSGCACCGLSRRGFLGAAAAAGSAALLPGLGWAQGAGPAAATRPRVIDTHHHYYPPDYIAAWDKLSRQPPFIKSWSPAKSIEEMDKNGVAASVLSLPSTPNVWFGADPAGMVRWSRDCNEFAARMVQDHPGRYGLFASLPMPNVEGSLKEIEHAFDVLKADGINLMTSFGDKWPGDPAYTPVFEELNRRKAVVYFHPYAPNCCVGLMPTVNDAYIEFPYDTGRTILSLLFGGTLLRFRDIKWLFSHGGGTIPMLAGRIAGLARTDPQTAKVAPQGIDYEFKRLYYDTANATAAPTMAALTTYIPMSQITFGTDYPYVPTKVNLDGLMRAKLPADQLAAVMAGNAEGLVPRLKA
jgi:predicted TIM-barrel fold metal-dependent hydrolase